MIHPEVSATGSDTPDGKSVGICTDLGYVLTDDFST